MLTKNILTNVIRKLGFIETIRLGLFTSLNEKTKQDLYAQKEITIQMICETNSKNIPDALMFVRNSLFPTPFDLLLIKDEELRQTVKEVFEFDTRILFAMKSFDMRNFPNKPFSNKEHYFYSTSQYITTYRMMTGTF